VIPHPAPLPATLCGGTFCFHIAPKCAENILAELAQAFEPGPFGQRTQDTGGPIFVPAAYPRELIGTAAPKEGGNHEAEDFTEQLLLGAQSPFDFDDEVIRQTHIVEGLRQGFDIALGLTLLLLMAFFRLQATTCESFGVFVAVSCGRGHEALLVRVCVYGGGSLARRP